ncbi:hypothetical protein LWI28_020886 [Acer negundo]|uniref:Pentatricopeptide repeat-containing protein n=1 Tax=Acer negundo TaxID=4023 RepID=A0AAD5IJ64_ACENE|nr:hypothetical protein LWI28_020886 [Acer negundo]
MYNFYGLHSYVRKFVHDFVWIHGNQPFNHSKTSIKCLHSLHRYKQKKPHFSNRRNTRKPLESIENEDAKPKVYMRDTISNIYTTLKYSSWDSAQEQLNKLPIKWDSYTVNQALKTHPPMEKAWLFFNWVSRSKGFKHDRFTYTTMLDIFGEAKRISSMKYVYEQMQEKGLKIDAVTYTSLMHWLSNSGDVDGAVKIWEEMKDNECCCPTVVSYTAYLKILFGDNRVKEATDVYKEMLQSGLSPNCYTYTVLMEHLVVSGKYEEALDIFRKMQEAGVQPDKAACNILIGKCCKAGETRAMIQILQYMKGNRIVLRYPVFMEALQTLKVAGESDALLRQVHPHISVESITDEEAVENAITGAGVPLSHQGLVLFLLKKQNLSALDHLLAGMMNKNIQLDPTIISTIIEANRDHCRPDGAFLAFEYSVKMGVKLERTAYLTLIGFLIRSNMFTKVVEIVNEMTTAGHSLGVYLGALLIYRLGCARWPVSAAKIFNLLPDDQKCTSTYTSLISVYFSAGSADKALKIFKTMKMNGIHPSLGTYNVLLAGLEKLGRVSDAETYRKERKSMQNDAHSRDTVPVEEKICDLLYAGNVAS